jgi:hypothetical protein
MTSVPDSDAREILKSLEPALQSIVTELKALEKKVDSGFAATNERLAGIDNRLSRVEGQLSNMPSGTMIVLTMVGGLSANALVIAGLVIGILNFLKVG